MKYAFSLGGLVSGEVKEVTLLGKLKDLGWAVSSKVKGTTLLKKSIGGHDVVLEVDVREQKAKVARMYADILEAQIELPAEVKAKAEAEAARLQENLAELVKKAKGD
ncbi:MAG: hypothetical protein QGG50_00505 [Methanopyri archaeon]|jgi:hypothetical protein|nr:hypothetical protein [Methanopyri archaeon]